jgi:Flp pilus assembly protein TadG
MSRWLADRRGVTAIEFGMVAMPFLLLLYGIIGVGLYFFTTFTLENAVEQASRLLRTGQAQQAGMTASQFKAKVQEFSPGFIDANKLRVNVQNYADSDAITADNTPKCLDTDRSLIDAPAFSSGTASETLLVIVCYEWDYGKRIPFWNFGNMGSDNKSVLIQAATTFRTEPYNN